MLYAFGLTEKYRKSFSYAEAHGKVLAKNTRGGVFETPDQAWEALDRLGRDRSLHMVFGVLTDLSNTYVGEHGIRRLLRPSAIVRLDQG